MNSKIKCWNIRDAINILFENDITEKQNMSNKEKTLLNILIKKQKRQSLC